MKSLARSIAAWALLACALLPQAAPSMAAAPDISTNDATAIVHRFEVLGQHELDEMLSERKKLSSDVQSILDAQTELWGIKVSNVEIRTVELSENMVRAIAKQAEAERDRRAKVIHADAEFQASQTLVNAATVLSSNPAAMQLRYLQTLTDTP